MMNTSLFIIAMILLAIGGIVGFGGILISFYIPYSPYFDGKRIVTYSEIEDMRHLCNGIYIIGEIAIIAATVIALIAVTA